MNILNDVSLTRLDTAELRTLADGMITILFPLAATDSRIFAGISMPHRLLKRPCP